MVQHAAPMASHVAALAAVIRELGLPPSAISPILAHAAAVRAESSRLGLVSEGDAEVVVARHSADSLLFALAKPPGPNEQWIDVGSGAGFPGIPLACCYPDASFLLVEPQRRRAGFLELQITRLGLDNASVAQTKAASVQGPFDVATARALADPAFALETLLRLVEPDGTVLVAVGSDQLLPPGVEELDVGRPGVDSPGRLFMIAHTRGGA